MSGKILRTAYFDCYSGISGDMILGALVDLGIPLDAIKKGLKKLDLDGYQIKSRIVKRGLISGTKIDVNVSRSKRKQHSRNFSNIRQLITGSRLPHEVQSDSVEIFRRIAKAEAKVHRIPESKVHFHEVGAVDSIVDIVGSVIGIHSLKLDRILSSPLNTGEGFVECEHGTLPVPAPATLELLKEITCFSSGVRKELTTPTGAAIIGFYASGFQSLPEMNILNSGYGAGGHVIKETPNLLRIVLGETAGGAQSGSMTVVETNIDDMNPELYEHVMDSLFRKGAVDVFFTPIVMKKNRPATMLSVMVPGRKKDSVIEAILKETSTFGLRFYEVDRVMLNRETYPLITPLGKVRIKVGTLDGEVIRISPEYEDCRKIANNEKMPLQKVYSEVLKLAENMDWTYQAKR